MITNEQGKQVTIVAHIMEYGSAPDGMDDKRWVITRDAEGATELYGIAQLTHSDGHVALMEALIETDKRAAQLHYERYGV